MRFVNSVLGVTILIFVTLSSAVAADVPPRPTPSSSPMVQEIKAQLDASRAAVAELTRSLATARGQAAVLDLQREITRIKTESRIEICRIQLRYAIAEGHAETAAKLEQVIADLVAPQSRRTPTRPAPASAGKR
jgi:hypothetical protein